MWGWEALLESRVESGEIGSPQEGWEDQEALQEGREWSGSPLEGWEGSEGVGWTSWRASSGK